MNGSVTDRFSVTVYPFVALSREMSLTSDSSCLYPIYIRNSEAAQTIVSHSSSDTYKYDYIPGGFNSGKEVTVQNYFGNDVDISFENSDTVSVKYDAKTGKLIATLKGNNVSGTFKAVVCFKDGKEYTGEFYVSQ